MLVFCCVIFNTLPFICCHFRTFISQNLRPERQENKKALFITSSGNAYAPGTPMAAYNFQEPYLRVIFGFIGLTDLQFIAADSMNLGEDAARHSREKAENALKELAATW